MSMAGATDGYCGDGDGDGEGGDNGDGGDNDDGDVGDDGGDGGGEKKKKKKKKGERFDTIRDASEALQFKLSAVHQTLPHHLGQQLDPPDKHPPQTGIAPVASLLGEECHSRE
ncbi:hypothetical protein TWF718_011264 [Orbilia javanica]|uniref:Uncharacterized protein n=1 Tax=Orbilia javanica TaxID=47235 RepID=A0AAN8MH36_9PEZI